MTRTRGKIFTYVAVALLIGGIFTATAFAASDNAKENGDRLQDGSCIDDTIDDTCDGPDRDRLQDGSCLGCTFTTTANDDSRGNGECDRLRDGSCLEE